MEDTEQGQEARAKTPLPTPIQEDLDNFIKKYGLDAVAQGIRDHCAKYGTINWVDASKLTVEERRELRLWGFAKKSAEHFLRDVLDHGPTSGCK